MFFAYLTTYYQFSPKLSTKWLLFSFIQFTFSPNLSDSLSLSFPILDYCYILSTDAITQSQRLLLTLDKAISIASVLLNQTSFLFENFLSFSESAKEIKKKTLASQFNIKSRSNSFSDRSEGNGSFSQLIFYA